jgi:hypothetical protein
MSMLRAQLLTWSLEGVIKSEIGTIFAVQRVSEARFDDPELSLIRCRSSMLRNSRNGVASNSPSSRRIEPPGEDLQMSS